MRPRSRSASPRSAIFGNRGLHGPDPTLRAQRASPALPYRAGRAGSKSADRRHGRRALPPSRRAAFCRMSSRASARAAPSTRPAFGSSGMPTATSRIRPRWSGCSSAIPKRSAAFARSSTAARFSLDELRYQYPSETEPGETAQEKLERLTWEGAAKRYPRRHSRCGRDDLPSTSCT